MKIGPNKSEDINQNNSSERYLEVLGIDDSNFSSLLHQAQAPREPNPAELPVVINKQNSLETITQTETDVSINLKALGEVGKEFRKEATYYFGKGILRSFFALPSVFSLGGVSKEAEWEYNGACIPIGGYLLLGLPYVLFYSCLFEINGAAGSTVLGTQITTNVISGIYEYARYKNNKLIEKNLRRTIN